MKLATNVTRVRQERQLDSEPRTRLRFCYVVRSVRQHFGREKGRGFDVAKQVRKLVHIDPFSATLKTRRHIGRRLTSLIAASILAASTRIADSNLTSHV